MFDPSRSPERDTLAAYLADATPLWYGALRAAQKASPHLVATWHFAGPKIGWSMRLLDKARVLMYLTPEAGRFRIGMVLGRQAVAEARSNGLSAAATSLIDIAPKYAEGYGVQFNVASSESLEPLEELLQIKLSTGQTSARVRRGT